MIDIFKKEKIKWFNFEEDESYKLKYMNESDQQELKKLSEEREKFLKQLTEDQENEALKVQYESCIKDFSKKLFDNVLDWKGVNGNGKPLECNSENKDILFNQSEYWSVERLNFVISKIINPDEFFNLKLKN